MIGEGDMIAIRHTWRGTHEGEFAGLDPTGKQVRGTGMVFTRFEDGKVIEDRSVDDTLGLLQQLGASNHSETDPSFNF